MQRIAVIAIVLCSLNFQPTLQADCDDNLASSGPCDSEGACQGPYTCNTNNNKCCPMKLNTGDCDDNLPSNGPCDSEGACQGAYTCNLRNNKCCPMKLNTGDCDGNLASSGPCDSEGACQGAYTCNLSNNKCCPMKLNTGDCDGNSASSGPCDSEGACKGAYTCNLSNNKCCPMKINTGDCDGNLLSSGPCDSEGACQGAYTCNLSSNKCCPIKLNAGDCDDNIVSSGPCDSEGACKGAYTCNLSNNKCCPMKVNTGDCDGNLASSGPCDSEGACQGAYTCNLSNNKCCPMKVNTGDCDDNVASNGPCDSEGACQGPYTCNLSNNKCCPIKLNAGDCDDNFASSGPCDSEGACKGAYTCNLSNNKCCPMKVNTGECDGNLASSGPCDNEGVCQGAYTCNHSNKKCCPMKVYTGDCEGNMTSSGPCDSEGKCSGAYHCNSKRKCCPIRVNNGRCPVVPRGTGGICVEECSHDNQCDDGKKCCSNGCGLTCQVPVFRPPGKCPSYNPDIVGICVGEDQGRMKCSKNTDCSTGELCCNSPCGSVCTPEDTTTPCERELMMARRQLLTRVDTCTPIFIPRCDYEGKYHRTQCYDNNGLCFCVHPNGTKIPGTEVRGNPDCSRATKPGVCPSISSVSKSDLVCSSTCGSDDDCYDDGKCCSNGCAYHCTHPSGSHATSSRRRRDTAGNMICDNGMQSSGPCSSEGQCDGTYVCNNNKNICCPLQINAGDTLCDNGMQSSGPCSSEGQCDGTYVCNNNKNICCPLQVNAGDMVCDNGMQSSGPCSSEGQCDGTYVCNNNKNICCPLQVNAGAFCVYRPYIDTTVTYVGDVASGKMPSAEACKAACDKNTLSECIGVVYQKENDGRCTKYSDRTHLTKTPLKGSVFYERLCQFSAGLCSNQTAVLMSNGVPKTCERDSDCGVQSFGCEKGHCCPRFNQPTPTEPEVMCKSGGLVVRDATGRVKSCDSANPCDQGEECQESVCCPKAILKDFGDLTRVENSKTNLCPDNGEVLMEDGSPKLCMTTADCGSVRYSCQGQLGTKYCCPAKFSTDVCPNGAIPLKQDGKPKTCMESAECGGAYSCQGNQGNKHCCPARLNILDACPNQGMVLISDRLPKRCTINADCLSSTGVYTCVENFCCPQKVNQNECPHNGRALMLDGQPRTCVADLECQGSGQGSFSCQQGYCCPQNNNVCQWNGMALIENGQAKTCTMDSDCQGRGYACWNGHCCPHLVNSVCVDGSEPKCCDINMCLHHTCPHNPTAVCRINPCGNCTVEFYDENNNRVDCSAGLTKCQRMRQKTMVIAPMWVDTTGLKADAPVERVNTETNNKMPGNLISGSTPTPKPVNSKAGQCPGVDPRASVAGQSPCTQDSDCAGDLKCCFSGRENFCTVPVHVPMNKRFCEMPPVVGECRAYFVRYFYNSTSKKCEQFVYGGCHGNENNFHTLDACQKGCMEGIPQLCFQEPSPGMCYAYIPMYFYNITSSRCEKFIYGGCQGNSNKFATLQQCYSTCSSSRVPSKPCERVRCPANTICVAKSDTEAVCVASGVLPDTPGMYVPDCLDDGNFAPVQCQGALCWCVDGQGDVLTGSLTVGRPNCTAVDYQTRPTPVQPSIVCSDGSSPKICDTCLTATCAGKKHVKCVADPCNNCQIKFVDGKGNTVQCGKKCDVMKPAAIQQIPDLECGNRKKVWHYNKVTRSCEANYVCSHDNSEGMYSSKLECQSECTASVCGGLGPMTCVTTCNSHMCKHFPTAVCRVNPCTCNVEFFDPVTNAEVNCNTVTPICQMRRAHGKMSSPSKLQMKDVTDYVCDERGDFLPQQCDKSNNCWCVDGLGEMTSARKIKVEKINKDIGCKPNKTSSAILSVKYDIDYSVVNGKEASFKRVFMKRLEEITPELTQYVKSIQVRRGSVIVDITLQTPDSNSGGTKDVGAFVNLLNSEISKGLDVTFEGRQMTSENQVSSQMTFQQKPDDSTKAPLSDDDHKKIVLIVVLTVVLAVALVILVVIVCIVRKKDSKFKSLEEGKGSPVMGHTTYFSNAACDKK